MINKDFSLLKTYEISTFNNKIYWVSAKEWSPYEAGFTDLVEPDDIFTDYHHGEGVIVPGDGNIDDILVLNPSNKMHGDEEDASSFNAELQDLPEWNETAYVVTSLNRLPSIRYCHNGDHVSPTEAVIVMTRLGYIWNPDRERFEKQGTSQNINQ